jgi:hypothetical protein
MEVSQRGGWVVVVVVLVPPLLVLVPLLDGVVELPVCVLTVAPLAAPAPGDTPAVPIPADVVEFAPAEPGAKVVVGPPVADPVFIPPGAAIPPIALPPIFVPDDCLGGGIVAPASPPTGAEAPAPAPEVCAKPGVASAMAVTNNAFFMCSLLAAYICAAETRTFEAAASALTTDR